MNRCSSHPRYRAVLFDAFRTLVTVGERAPMMRVDAPSWRPAMREVFARFAVEHPQAATDHLLDTFEAVTRELALIRRQFHREIPLAYRYELTFRRLAWPEETIRSALDRIVQTHRAALCEHCSVDTEAKQLIQYCHALGMRVGVVSNFDDAASVHAVLERAHLHRELDVVVVSADVGWRKPHPAIFRCALGAIGVAAEEALFVGDSFEEDVHGPHRIGMETAWLVPQQAPAEQRAVASFCLTRLPDLREALR